MPMSVVACTALTYSLLTPVWILGTAAQRTQCGRCTGESWCSETRRRRTVRQPASPKILPPFWTWSRGQTSPLLTFCDRQCNCRQSSGDSRIYHWKIPGRTRCRLLSCWFLCTPLQSPSTPPSTPLPSSTWKTNPLHKALVPSLWISRSCQDTAELLPFVSPVGCPQRSTAVNGPYSGRMWARVNLITNKEITTETLSLSNT